MDMDERIKEIANQINFRELRMAGFKFIYDNEKLNLGVIKGAKHFIISLNVASDTYEIRKVKIRKCSIVEDTTEKNIYCDELCGKIEEYFKFEYVMRRIFN